MRIIAGKFKNRRLITHGRNIPKGSIKPTTAKIREVIFNILQHSSIFLSFDPEKITLLDVCCGTGALGFEALSRGISYVHFIDINRNHLALVRENANLLSVDKQVNITCADAISLPPSSETFNIVYIDPPYCNNNFQKILDSLKIGKWITHESLLIIETSAKHELQLSYEFEILEIRIYGTTKLIFLRIAA